MAKYIVTNKTVSYLGVITDKDLLVITEFSLALGMIFALLGLGSNIINIRTFIAMGVSDGITVSFLALSIFDLTSMIAAVSLGISTTFHAVETQSSIRFPIQPYGVSVFLSNAMVLINVTNVLTTTFISVARCMCVVKPLHFKNDFTPLRTLGFLLGFAAFAIAIYSPVLTNIGMLDMYDWKINMTRLTLCVSPNREAIKGIVDVMIEVILPFATQFIVVVSVLVMVASLRAASKFRKKSVLTPNSKHCRECRNTTNVSVKNGILSQTLPSSPKKASTKDMRLHQQVILTSLVYIICNTPKIVITLVGAVEVEFALGKRYSNIYLGAHTLRKLFDNFNAAIHTVIYYRYNTKFRTALRH